jgi:archaellum component FlaF (FlaF/FlaG flagellin family)
MIQKYKIDTLNYNYNYQVRSDCNDITFYNSGGVNLTLNSSLVLTPGASISFSGNEQEIDTTIYTWVFPAGAGVKSITIFRKIYY